MAATAPDRNLGWIVLAIVAALFVLPMFAMGFGVMGTGSMMGTHGGHGMWDGGDGAWSWMVVLGVAIQLLLLALLVGAGYVGYRALTSEDGSTDPALEELRLAYARGDLDDEAFERRRERLESDE